MSKLHDHPLDHLEPKCKAHKLTHQSQEGTVATPSTFSQQTKKYLQATHGPCMDACRGHLAAGTAWRLRDVPAQARNNSSNDKQAGGAKPKGAPSGLGA